MCGWPLVCVVVVGQVPNMATLEGRVDKKRVISHNFRKLLHQYETQVGPAASPPATRCPGPGSHAAP
jgi:hypothetical protein